MGEHQRRAKDVLRPQQDDNKGTENDAGQGVEHLYEAINGEEMDKRNFRKRIKEMDFIEKTELIDKTSSKRGASLYRFNKNAYNEDPNFKL